MITPAFEDFIRQCFRGDLRTAQLRLSDEEKLYVLYQYQNAKFIPLKDVENEDDKIWYEVIIG